jgi:3-phenylpropionate/trans-cinnamate dioxygenase ferredoxin reductase component
MSEPIVVIGAGLTAAKAVEQLRQDGHTGPVVVLGDEPHLPYERPPLSKGYLMGEATVADATVHDQGWYDDHDVDLRLGVTVTGIDRTARSVVTGEREQPFEQLLLATGAAPRRLAMADESGADVRYLRTLDDSTRLRESLQAGRRLAIIGGGWIGLEVAAAARTAGCEVTVLESLDLPLLRVLGPEVAERFAALHRGHGVDLRTGVSITGIHADGTTAVLRLDAGEPVGSDLLVVGIGVAPRTALAEAAGLDVDNGIVVDEHLRTSDPAILAAGDVANAYHPRLGRHLRVEHWDNAIAQGQAAARTMLGGGTPYERLPYFFTDQYDLGMEYVGSVGPDGYDRVVLRGGPDGDAFTAFWLQGDQVLAGMHANDWDAIDDVRRIVERGRVSEALLDAEVPLADV